MVDIGGSFASRLKASRIHCGLSQADLAARVGLAQSAISQFEAGRSTPRLETLAKLASALGVSTSVLVPQSKEVSQ